MKHLRSSFRVYLILLGYCLLPHFTVAQGWQRFAGGAGDQRAFSIRLLPDGGVISIGSTNDSVGGLTDWFFLRADALGNIVAQNQWGGPDSSEYAVALMSIDTQILMLGNVDYTVTDSSGSTQKGGIIWDKVDFQGNKLNGGFDAQAFAVAASSIPFENGHLVLGANYLSNIDFYYPQPYCFLLDSNGAVAWNRILPGVQAGEAVDAVSFGDHHAFVAAQAYNDTSLADLVFYKINATGDVLLEKHWILPGNETPTALLKSTLDELFLVGDEGASPFARTIIVANVDPMTLAPLGFHRVELPGSQTPHAAIALSDGNIAIVGEHIPDGSTSRDAFLALFDPVGNLLWFKTYGGLKGDIFWDIQENGDGNGFVIAGQTASFSVGNHLQAWLLRTDSLGQVWSNRVMGKVVRDDLQNCLADATEIPLAHWLVTASGAVGALYTLTDSTGGYNMEVDTGAWFISTLPPTGYWLPCEDSIELVFNQLGDTLTADFPTQVLYNCPLLEVDITTPILRRCFENIQYVRYYNYGTSTATEVLISIVLDPYLSITGSSLPYTQSGDTLLFSVGTVPWLTGGNFQFSTSLSCDSTVLGQMHCTAAHIYPDSLCYTFDPDWDGSHLDVDGYCAGDSVVLTVTNTGFGMQEPVSYIITEDQIIFKISALQLATNQDTTFVLYPNGATVTIVVTQSPGHPGNSQPMLVVEGCGGGAFNTGYAFQFPQNDGDPAVDIECRPNIGSFDPNDKTGLPLGVSAAGIIAPGTKLEYLIRFQNTGTDTAFRVEIRDTLSKLLDLATFREGASSHPYRLEISSIGVLNFIFLPIALPDSAANWAGSQGFVKFSISPMKGIAPGTEIWNNAAIYFDQNPAVVTNTTLHTIDDPIPYLNTKTLAPDGASAGRLLIVPNPTQNHILVNLLQPSNSGGLYVELTNLLGKNLLAAAPWLNPGTESTDLDLSQVPAGIYFIIVKDVYGNIVARERIIKI